MSCGGLPVRVLIGIRVSSTKVEKLNNHGIGILGKRVRGDDG